MAAHTDYWLQRSIAIAQTIGVNKKQLLEDYYFDEFIAMLDEYNEIHRIDKTPQVIEEDADAW